MHYILVSLYLASRLWNLLSLPPFVDELLYIRWTESIYNNPSNLWLPVIEDGQPPLFFWISSLFKATLGVDTLLILRSVSITFGLMALIMIIKLGSQLFGKKIGFISGFIYTVFPMFLWYDRLGMRESLITLSGLLLLYGLSKRLLYHESSGSYLTLVGLTLGLLTKGTAVMFVPVIVVSYFIMRKKVILDKSDYWCATAAAAILLLLYFGGSGIVSKGETFLLSPSQIIPRLYPNLYSTIRWVVEYSTIPIFGLGALGIYKLSRRKPKIALFLFVSITTVVGLEIATAAIYFPRYFLWILIVWILAIAYGVNTLLVHKLGRLILLPLFVPLIIFDYQIIVDPITAPLPAIERWQYITGWPSGYGIKEMSKLAEVYPIEALIVEKNEACKTGLRYYGLSNYATILNTDSAAIEQALQNNLAVFACLNIDTSAPHGSSWTLLHSVERPENKTTIKFYAVQ